MRQIFTYIIFLHFLSTLNAQEVPKYGLDSIDLASFKEEARYKYLLFFESTLNLIDTRLDIEDRYRSRSVIMELFSNSTSTIIDILDSPRPSSYDPYTYGYELLRNSQELPLLYKRYKYSDDFKFVRQSYKGLDLNTDKKGYDIYEGEMFVLEKLINSKNIPASLLNKPTFNAYEEGLVKRIKFKLGHNSQREYEMTISTIDILPANNKAYDYKSIVKNIEKSPYPWSDQSEEEYLSILKQEAETIGILPPIAVIDQNTESLIKKEINIVFKEDTLTYTKPQISDYVFPGYGHMRYGLSSKTRFLKTVIYGGVFIGSTVYATYSKIQSEKSYQLHKESVTFRDANNNYSVANKYHQRFIISTGIAVGSIVVNAFHINFSNKQQLKRIQQARKNKKTEAAMPLGVLLPEINMGSELSFMWKF